MRRTLLFVLVLLGAVIVVVPVLTRDWLLDRIAPFTLNDPPGLLTGTQLRRFEREPEQCFDALRRGGVAFERAPAREIKDGCGYTDGAVLVRSEIDHGGRVLMRCPALVALLLWERHVAAPAAERHMGRKLVAIRHFGTHSCRNINHAKEGRRSQHATANAIDVAGFSFAGGETVTVARDWSAGGRKQEFLHAVRDGACKVFAVLSPDYNRAHRDHFHLDRGRWSLCR